jgi:hypothetical protein
MTDTVRVPREATDKCAQCGMPRADHKGDHYAIFGCSVFTVGAAPDWRQVLSEALDYMEQQITFPTKREQIIREGRAMLSAAPQAADDARAENQCPMSDMVPGLCSAGICYQCKRLALKNETSRADALQKQVDDLTRDLEASETFCEGYKASNERLIRELARHQAHEYEHRAWGAEVQIVVLREALEWYGEQARLARLVHSEGDTGRHNLADDGGKRARATLTATEPAKESE